jgi:hypothetical protein
VVEQHCLREERLVVLARAAVAVAACSHFEVERTVNPARCGRKKSVTPRAPLFYPGEEDLLSVCLCPCYPRSLRLQGRCLRTCPCPCPCPCTVSGTVPVPGPALSPPSLHRAAVKECGRIGCDWALSNTCPAPCRGYWQDDRPS